MNVREQIAMDSAELRAQIQRVQAQLDGDPGQMPHLRVGLERQVDDLRDQLSQLARPVLSESAPDAYVAQADASPELRR